MKTKEDNEVKVGQEVTAYVGTDRYPYVVVSVSNSRNIMVESKKEKSNDRLDIKNLSLRKDGKWKEVGVEKYTFYVVHTNGTKAEKYLDPHF